jgi:hypothetical protein
MAYFFLFGLLGYWHCGQSCPIVPASGDSFIIIIWFVTLLALRPLLAYCASLG